LTRCRRCRTALLLVALLLDGVAAAADWPLTILELEHRLPDEVIPLLAPLAGPDGVVTGANASLFVRASPERLADLRAALERIDRPAQNLLVELRGASAAAAHRRGYGITVDESVGDDGHIRVGDGRGTGVRAGAGSVEHRRGLIGQVRVMDGGQAFIAVGEERPVSWRETVPTPQGLIGRGGVGYARAGSGFYVRPHRQGDRVTVEIWSQDASFGSGPRGGVIQTGKVDTRVTGRLGEWIPLGSVREVRFGERRDLGGWGERAGGASSELEIRVTAW
jgi:hypothetical protein